MKLRSALAPMLEVDPVHWRGLPHATVAEIDALFGKPERSTESMLGVYPATRRVYRCSQRTGGLAVWARDGEAVMVEALQMPAVSVLNELPEPSAVLPHEILVADAYAHEYLYCGSGLVLTVAEPLQSADKTAVVRIVRCRGVKPLARVADFDAHYYQAFEAQVHWGIATNEAS